VSWVGRPLPRYEDPVLLQGRGRYTADLAQGARILRFVRSPIARGGILAVNAPPEMQIITAAVLGDVKPICPSLDRPDYVPVAQPILASERVTYVGEPIAAVIADTAAEAEDLAEQVTVEIAAETPVVTLDQALAPGAPLVHDIAARNTLIDARFETSGVVAALAAAHRVVEFTFTSGRQAAAPLEPRGAVAAFDAATGRVTLSASTQMPHLLRTGIADDAIDLFEARPDILELQRGSTRYLHPHFYDWPAEGSDQADAGLPIMNWHAGSAGDVAAMLRAQFDEARRSSILALHTDHRVSGLVPSDLGPIRVVVPDATAIRRIYDVVILAIGFGLEAYLDGDTSSY
jgi:Molybdopterin-binding domain of aldehyde dehydrogenase/Aldehyde oxidase and xanthine dehydrogenase, a/b hammerhead domain